MMNGLRKVLVIFISIVVVIFGLSSCANDRYNIDFMVGDSLYSTVITNGKEEIQLPNDPTKTGYQFLGWFFDQGDWTNQLTATSLEAKPISSNVTVYAYFMDVYYLQGTDIEILGATNYVFDGIGEVIYLNQPNSTIVVQFADIVKTNPNSTWSLASDLSGINIIPSKAIVVAVGNSPLYYITVRDKNGNQKIYIVIVHRNYIFDVFFNTNGGSYCSPVFIEEGHYLHNVPISEKTGYHFEGWDYDFVNNPIRDNTIVNAIWKANVYSLTLDVNGGNTFLNPVIPVTYDRSYTLPTPTRNGYTFIGWFNGATRVFSGVWKFATDITLKALWEITTFSISYELQGGDSTLVTLPKSYTVEDTLIIGSPSRKGYTFIGWSSLPSGENAKLNYQIKEGTVGNLTLYAIWQPNQYTITYNPNGGEIDQFTQIVSYDDYIQLLTPYRFGYSFDGWRDGETQFSSGVWNQLTNVSLSAEWKLNSYNLRFELNGGATPIDYPTHYTVNDIGNRIIDEFLESYPPLRSGYIFTGWFDDANLTKTSVLFSEQTWLSDRVIYAGWIPNSYKIYLDVNNGAELENSVLSVVYDTEYVLPTPTRTGYSFSGWFLGNEKYTTGTWKLEEDLYLTANWVMNTYRINYDLDGGENHENNPSSFTFEDEEITLESPTKIGYQFLGWTSETVITPTIDLQIFHNSHEDYEIKANWQPNKYQISFALNGGNQIEDTTIEVSFNQMVVFPTPSRVGYTFLGWYHDDVKYESGLWTTPSSLALTALWSEINYGITYILSGGTNNSTNPNSYTYDGGSIVLSEPIRPGYSFVGWTTPNDLNPILNKVIPNNSVGDLSFTANWIPKSYVVTFDVNGGNALETNEDIYTFDTEIILPTPSRLGYDFLGWYLGDKPIFSGIWKLDSDVVLEAKWTAKSYTITTFSNGFESSTTVSFDSTYILNHMAIDGFSFDGYFDEENGNGTRYTDNQGNSLVTYTELENSTLFAHYIYLVKFETNGGSTVPSQTFNFNEPLESVLTPSKTNRTFGGWYMDASLTTPIRLNEIVGNITMYAKWLEEADVSKMEYSIIDNSVVINKCPASPFVIFPNYIGGFPVEKLAIIKYNVFNAYDLYSKMALILPNTLKILGFQSLALTNTDEVRIPRGVHTIEENVFSSTRSIMTLFIPNSVLFIGRAILSTNGTYFYHTILCEFETLPLGWHIDYDVIYPYQNYRCITIFGQVFDY